MTAQPLIQLLEKLLKLHKSLAKLAIEKLDVIKKGDIDALNLLMKNEQTHIHAIQMVEGERIKMVALFMPEKKDPVLTDCLPLFTELEQEQIATLHDKLITELNQLKAANQLNQQLLEQSLQFVNLHLDLLLPEEQPNYSKDHEEESSLPKVSLFDSKA